MNRRYLKREKAKAALLRIIVSNTEKAVLQKITKDMEKAQRIKCFI